MRLQAHHSNEAVPSLSKTPTQGIEKGGNLLQGINKKIKLKGTIIRGSVTFVVIMGEVSVRKEFCVAVRIWRPACGSRLGVSSGWESSDQSCPNPKWT